MISVWWQFIQSFLFFICHYARFGGALYEYFFSISSILVYTNTSIGDKLLWKLIMVTIGYMIIFQLPFVSYFPLSIITQTHCKKIICIMSFRNKESGVNGFLVHNFENNLVYSYAWICKFVSKAKLFALPTSESALSCWNNRTIFAQSMFCSYVTNLVCLLDAN